MAARLTRVSMYRSLRVNNKLVELSAVWSEAEEERKRGSAMAAAGGKAFEKRTQDTIARVIGSQMGSGRDDLDKMKKQN